MFLPESGRTKSVEAEISGSEVSLLQLVRRLRIAIKGLQCTRQMNLSHIHVKHISER